MNLLPLLYALLAALTGVSGGGESPVRSGQVAQANAVALVAAVADPEAGARRAGHAILVEEAAKIDRRVAIRHDTVLSRTAVEAALPLAERPARRRE